METTEGQRGGRLSGLVPLVVIGLIAFLFIRSCLGNLDLGFGLGGDGDEERELPGTTEPEEDEESASNGSATPADDPELQAMLEPVEPRCPAEEGEDTRHLQWTEPPPMCIDPDEHTFTAVLNTSRGDIEIELDDENAPEAVNNFVFLSRWHYYDGVEFHVVFPEQGSQAGLPDELPDGVFDPGYTFEDELPNQNNGPLYPKYSVLMGNTGRADTNGSVFIIVTGADRERAFTRFGQITDPESQEVVDAIDATGIARAGHDGTPEEETIIHSVTIREE